MNNDVFVKKRSSGARINKLIVRLALFLSILAGILIFFIVLTVYSSNRLMNVDGSDVSNIPSNVLPSYSTCSFESFDEQTNLSGWFFKCEEPISTIIVVHNSGSNRLPFGVNMVDLIELWLENNYNVFLFDLRNSGESEGDISCYGYLEWQDVIGAIEQVKKISVTTDVILYGIGSGCTSICLAYSKLPESNLSDAEKERLDSKFTNLGFDRGYVKGMILDSPAMSSDDYIKPIVEQNEFLGKVTKNFVPLAIRFSAGEDKALNIASEVSRMPIPVCIIYGGHDVFIGADNIKKLVNDRMRLNSNLTEEMVVPGAGYLEAFSMDNAAYCDEIIGFLHKYFG